MVESLVPFHMHQGIEVAFLILESLDPFPNQQEDNLENQSLEVASKSS